MTSPHHQDGKRTPAHIPDGKPRWRDLALWLTAEAEGRDTEAEKALATLFARVGRLEPSPGFAERVLGELVPALQPRPWGRWLRAGLAALILCWLLVGALTPSLLAPASRLVSVAEILDGIGRALDWAARGLAGLGDLWSAVSGVAQAVATATGTLPLAVLLLAGLGIAGLALRALSDLMARERSWSHVHFGT